MVLGFTHKRKNQAKQATDLPIRSSLSLPDLSQSLHDIHEWADLPFALRPAVSSTTQSRHRKLSAVGSSPQFHRPFSPSMLPTTRTESFRIPTGMTSNQRDSFWSSGTGRAIFRSTRRAKQPSAFNIVLAGAKGVGKTSFARALQQSVDAGRSTGDSAVIPTRCIKTSTFDVAGQGLERLSLKIYDTPGLALDVDDNGGVTEKERGVRGLLCIIEDKLTVALKEEAKVVRRQPTSKDQLIHLVIYMIDARTVMNPSLRGSDIDVVSWCEQIEAGLESPPREPHLPIGDMDIIERLVVRSNVLPVLARTDSLTRRELAQVKDVTRRDLAARFGANNGYGFGIFWDDGADDTEDSDPIDEVGEDVDERHGREDPRAIPLPPSPLGHSPSAIITSLPLAIFAQELDSGHREYRWGVADVMDPEHSDFALLKDAVLGPLTKTLRQRTRETLYEHYRTEQLTAQRSAPVAANPNITTSDGDWAMV